MIAGIGVDLVELSRVARALARWGDRFVDKIMDPPEVARLPEEREARIRAVACAIALKEAASKALGTGWSQGVHWRHVIAAEGPPPGVTLAGGAAERAERLGCRPGTASLQTRGDLVIGEVWLDQVTQGGW